MRRLAALSAAVATLAVSFPAAATVDSVTLGACPDVSYAASDFVPLVRGRTVTVTVKGFAVDETRAVEVSGLTGVSANVKARHHGFGSSLDVELSASETAALTSGRIQIRYTVEASGFDTFHVQVFEAPRIDGLAFLPEPGVFVTSAGTTLLPGFDHTLVARGTKLIDVRPRIPLDGFGIFTDIHVVSSTDTELRVSLKPMRLMPRTLDAGSFRVEIGRCPVPPSGAAKIDVTIAVPPTPTPTPTPRPPTPDLHQPIPTRPGAGLLVLPTTTPTPNAACQKDRDRDLARLSADALRCGDTAACVQIRKDEQKAIEARFQACLAKGGS